MCVSLWRMVRCMGAAPRHRGRSEGWTLIHPQVGILRKEFGRMSPYATTIATSGCRVLSFSCSVVSVRFWGVQTGRSYSCA